MKRLLIMLLVIPILMVGLGIAIADIQRGGPNVLKLKGLYLGMNINEACNTVNSHLNASYTVDTEGRIGMMVLPSMGNTLEKINDLFPSSAPAYQPGQIEITSLLIKSDNDKKVCYISFGSNVVDKLFSTKGIDAKDFAQEFLKAYNIPAMEPFYDDSGSIPISGWEFVSPYGYKVRITSEKTLIIESVAKKSGFKFD